MQLSYFVQTQPRFPSHSNGVISGMPRAMKNFLIQTNFGLSISSISMIRKLQLVHSFCCFLNIGISNIAGRHVARDGMRQIDASKRAPRIVVKHFQLIAAHKLSVQRPENRSEIGRMRAHL